MAYRRNFSKASQGQIRRKAVVMTMAILVIILLVNMLWSTYQQPYVHEIKVQMLEGNVFVVQQDTTNYQQFASVLKKAVIKARKEYPTNRIVLELPDSINKSSEISSIIMVVTAMDLDWQIKN